MTTPVKAGAISMATLEQLAEDSQLPVVLCDHYVTRRQRVHTLIAPGDPHPYTSLSLVEVINRAAEFHGNRAILANVDLAGTMFACYIDVTRYNPEVPSDGKTRRTPALARRTRTDR